MKKPKGYGLIDRLYLIKPTEIMEGEEVTLHVYDLEYFEHEVLGKHEPGSYWHRQYSSILESTAIYDDTDMEPIIIYDRKVGTVYASTMEALRGTLH